MRDQLAQLRFTGLAVLSRGVDTGLFTPERHRAELRAVWGAASEDPVAIYVGRLAAEKNLALAVRAFLAIRTVSPRARFVLVGDGPERAPLMKLHPTFHYAGMRRGEDLAAHYASADLFLFPSLTETFGNVVTEALASGLVVLAYDYAASRQHIRSGENGMLVSCNDAGAFLAGAESLIKCRAQWPFLRLAARAAALSLTWEKIVGQFEAKLLQHAAPGGPDKCEKDG
jgi:glycosyltransferase involved in cell wall biosynthesis